MKKYTPNKKFKKKTLHRWGYNLFEYMIKIIRDDALYTELKNEQNSVNHLILNIQKKLV